MQIETATLTDISALADLLTILFSQEAEFIPDNERQAAGLRQIVENPAIGTILVLRHDESIYGMVSLLYTISTALGGRVAMLEDMIIHPDHRGNGTGSRLLSAAIEHARREGCRRITLLTDLSNVAAQRFYARRGFVLSEMVPMRLLLDEP